MEQWDSDGGTVWCNSGTVIVEQCCGTVEQCWWNSVVEHWNSDSGTVLWNSETLMVEQCLWNSETVIVEQCGGTLEQ